MNLAALLARVEALEKTVDALANDTTATPAPTRDTLAGDLSEIWLTGEAGAGALSDVLASAMTAALPEQRAPLLVLRVGPSAGAYAIDDDGLVGRLAMKQGADGAIYPAWPAMPAALG